MQAEQDAGAKGIASSGGAADVVCGQLEGGLPEIVTFTCAGECAFGKMNHDQFADALLEQRTGGVAECSGIESAVGLADFEAGGFASFDFVEDAVVNVLEGGADDFGEAIAVFADDIHAGFDAGRLGVSEQSAGFGAEFGVGLIERIK